MAVPSSIDVSGWLHEQLAEASPDLLRASPSFPALSKLGGEARHGLVPEVGYPHVHAVGRDRSRLIEFVAGSGDQLHQGTGRRVQLGDRIAVSVGHPHVGAVG